MAVPVSILPSPLEATRRTYADGQRLARWRSHSCPVPRDRRQQYFNWPANAEVFQLDRKSGEPSDPLSSVDKLLTLEDNGRCARVCSTRFDATDPPRQLFQQNPHESGQSKNL